MVNILDPAVVMEINRRLLAAESNRNVAMAVGVSKGAVQRWRKRIASDLSVVMCVCGLPASHRGWCRHRVANSPARQAFLAKWMAGRPPAIIRVKAPPRVSLSYPFLPEGNNGSQNGADIVLLVNGAVPKHLPEQIRADACQEILLAILAGEISPTDVGSEVKRFISKTRKLNEAHYMAFSIDQPRRDGGSWHDVLQARDDS